MSLVSKLLKVAIQSAKTFEPTTLIENSSETVKFIKLTEIESSSSYISFQLIRRKPNYVSLETHMASEAELEELYNERLSEKTLFRTLKRVLPKYEDVGQVMSEPVSLFNNQNEEEPTEDELKSIQTLAESILDTKGLPELIDKAFPNGKIDPSSLVPKPITYTFTDPKNPEIKHTRELTTSIFHVLEGEPVLAQTITKVYNDLTASEPHGKVIITTFNASKTSETLFKFSKSLKMSKLGITMGLNFSGLFGGDQAKALQDASNISEGDEAFSNGKKQDFTFGLDHLKLHAKLMLSVQRKLQSNYTANAPVIFEF